MLVDITGGILDLRWDAWFVEERQVERCDVDDLECDLALSRGMFLLVRLDSVEDEVGDLVPTPGFALAANYDANREGRLFGIGKGHIVWCSNGFGGNMQRLTSDIFSQLCAMSDVHREKTLLQLAASQVYMLAWTFSWSSQSWQAAQPELPHLASRGGMSRSVQ
jgi:hypothetical protein